MNNFLGLVIAFSYIFAILGIAEGLRRWRGYGNEFTRKFIHIGVGMLSWTVPLLFNSPWPFVFACLTFAILNLLDWRYGFFSAMASGERSNLGSVYFPLSAGIVAIIFWEQPPIMVAALMPLTWGDAIASVIGRAGGRHTYIVFGHRRSFEGSSVFFIVGGFFTWLALWLMPGSPDITPAGAFLPALVVIFSTTMVEAISPWGLDNLTVTATAILILNWWPF